MMAIPASKEELLRIAEQDYCSDLVTVNSSILKAFRVPDSGPMQISVQSKNASDAPQALAFLLAMTALNYKFWSVPAVPGPLLRYRFKGQKGARALWAAFEDFWVPGEAQLDAHLTRSQLESWFGAFFATQDRCAILQEFLPSQGGPLAEFCEMLSNRVLARGAVTVEDASLLAHQFPLGFGDPYLKKAQLALSMFCGYSAAQGLELKNSNLTAMADYQVPRVLRAISAISYSDALADLVDQGKLIPEGSPEERAIRSATVLACEELAALSGVASAAVDNALWLSQELAGTANFHLTPTTRY